MVLYWITLIHFAEELRLADLGLLSPFYMDDVAFGGLTQQSAQLLNLLMKRGTDRGYFPEPDSSLCILDTPGHEEEEEAKWEFAMEGLTLNFVSGSR